MSLTRAPPRRSIPLALGAAAVSLACALVGMFVARAHLLQANAWVQHTSNVEQSIAACRIDVRDAQFTIPGGGASLTEARGDLERIAGLTVDNPSQQSRVKELLPLLRASPRVADDGVRIDQILRELGTVEDSLMRTRLATLRRATQVGWLVIAVSAILTVLFAAFVLSALHRQSLALAQAEINLRRGGALLESVVDSMVDGVMAITPERRFLHVNRAARRLLGDGFPAESFPQDWRSNVECIYEDGTAMKPEDGALARAIMGKSTDGLVYRTRQTQSADSTGVWISATARPVRDADGTVIAGVVALRDITEQRLQQDQLRAMSMSDELTGLNNRRGFLLLAEQHARVAQRQGEPFAIVFADLNGLKTINDTLGHEAGDRSIRAAADVLRETFRDSDVISRLGGDEFVALLVNTDSAMRDTIAGRLRQGLAARNVHEAPALQLSLSVGISFFEPGAPLPVADLMIEADRLMYADKRGRRLPA
jgi:diguanylate cyclase (GGDEF)-like protein